MIRMPRFADGLPRSTDRLPRQSILTKAKGIRVSPTLVACLAVLGLNSTIMFGALGVMAFIGSTGALLVLRPLYNAKQLVYYSPLLLLPVLAIASTMWSPVPAVTMRAALELLLTFAAAILIAGNLSPEKLIAMMFASALISALIWIPFIPQSYLSGWPLGGPGYKNPVGFTGFMLTALSIGIIFDRTQPGYLRLASIASLPLGLVIAKLSQSGGSAGSLALMLLVFPPLALLGAFRGHTRIALIALAILLLGVGCFFIDDIVAAVTNFRSQSLGKDATLTGRTYLWEVAGRLADTKPALGAGYSSFWRQGNIDAEGLWRVAGIADRAGFNFHNAFVEMRMDLGWTGVTILAILCAAVICAGLARQVLYPRVAVAAMIALVSVNLVRSYVEDGLIAPWSTVSVLLLATFVYATTGLARPAMSRRWSAGRQVKYRRSVNVGSGERYLAVSSEGVQRSFGKLRRVTLVDDIALGG